MTAGVTGEGVAWPAHRDKLLPGTAPPSLPARSDPGRAARVYFVTTKRAGYALFALTPSERAAIGVTEDQRRVHLLQRVGAEWRVHREWPVETRSHTELMTRLALVEEPATIEELERLGTGS
jgi:hypothetical protein